MRGQEVVRPLINAAAGTSTPFELKGGAYAIDTDATGAGTIDLQRLGPDGVTYFAAITQITVVSSRGAGVALTQGLYRVVAATFTAIYVTVARIPAE